jgi:hypothetical protein
MFRFTIRDVLWLTVVVALAVGWSLSWFVSRAEIDRLLREQVAAQEQRDEWALMAEAFQQQSTASERSAEEQQRRAEYLAAQLQDRRRRELPVAPALKLPEGWTHTITVSTPPMELNPSPTTGLPAGQVVQPFRLTIWVRERISEEAMVARVKMNEEIRAQLPHSKVIPPEFRELERQILLEADFYDERAAYEIDYPGYLPDSPEDRAAIVKVYDQLRSQWSAYPSSRHSEKSYFPLLLESGYVPHRK